MSRVETAQTVERSLERLESYIVAERLRGYDPYDALTSPLFQLPMFRSARPLRLAAQQALKRAPYNFRPVLAIPKGYNPVTLALVLEASAYRAHVDLARAEDHRERARACIVELVNLRSRGYQGDCWGYPFDWESRYGRLPAFTPTIVATGMVTNALFTAHRLLQVENALDLCLSAAEFVLKDLPRTAIEDGAFCWGYFPSDTQRVLNATMKGARLCAQMYSLAGDARYLEPAAQTTAYVARYQREDGSWPYAVGDVRSWADNFHTAYVLDALDSYERCTSDEQFTEVKERGWRHYREKFFAEDRIPKYYANRIFPVDSTACAQSLVTLCRFGDIDTAMRVATWAMQTMQCSDGRFAYQLRRRRLIRIPYMRWASAYMYLGLSRLAYALADYADAT